ncbi:MAG: YraN family protein [Clostridia bacterium]|nr:YraN family protein [Clostridia bacterium]
MPNNRTFGDLGEDLAERHLKSSGFRILSRNYLAKGGEIDIIGYRRGVLAFFEVKTRSGETFGRPADAVDGAKLAKITKAARDFCTAYVQYGKVPVTYFPGMTIKRTVRKRRIDVVEVFLSRDNRLDHINHIGDVCEL